MPGVETGPGFTAACAFYCVLLVGVWALCLAALIAAGYEDTIEDVPRGTWALKLQNLIHHAVISTMAIAALLSDEVVLDAISCGDVTACQEAAALMIRDPASASISTFALAPVTVGYMAADVLLISQWNMKAAKSNTESMLMVVHHLLSVVCWPVAIVLDFCSRYVLILLSYEFSSIFLAVNWLLSTAGYKKGPAYLVSGFLFTIFFILVRLIGALPQLRAMWLAPPWLASSANYPGIYSWMTCASMALVVPHVLNFFWGYKVITGALALVCVKKTENKDEKDQDEADKGLITESSTCSSVE